MYHYDDDVFRKLWMLCGGTYDLSFRVNPLPVSLLAALLSCGGGGVVSVSWCVVYVPSFLHPATLLARVRV